MKPRRVFVTLELETSGLLADLRDARCWDAIINHRTVEAVVIQAQANVAARAVVRASGKAKKVRKKA